MSMDLDIQRTIEAGRRNLEAKQLIHNWCRHARVEKFGGTGVIEAQTGLPIGHHSMACDYAPASGMATWLLEESAVYFHDANCVRCPKRQPVDLPNISKLVAQRDRDVELAKVRAQDETRKKEAAFQDRCIVRDKVRESAPVPTSTFLDDLQAFDAERSDENARRLIESASLAPETLTPELTEHLFALLEGQEHWFDNVGLTVLGSASSDRPRLTRCAMRCLATGRALDLAAAIVSERISAVNAEDVREAVAGLAYVASPPPEIFQGEARKGKPKALTLIAATFPPETARGIDALLAHREPFQVSLGARALALLIQTDAKWHEQFLVPLTVLLSRADHLIDVDRDSALRRVTQELTRALAQVFLRAPTLTDSELMAQFGSASPDGEARLVGVYEHVVRRAGEKGSKKVEIKDFEPYRVAMIRFVTLAESSDNEEVVQHLVGALRHPSASLAPLAKDLMDLYLGAAALLDSKLSSPPPDPVLVAPKGPLEALEQESRRTNLWYLRSGFIKWAVQGACFDAPGLAAFESFLAKRNSLSDSLLAAIIEETSPLFKTSAGLKAILPYLYSGMVGPSTLVRASAARAIAEIGSTRFAELPGLVSEALVLMLTDPYVIVHKAAVRAVGQISLPKPFDTHVAPSLQTLIVAYRSGDDHDFLLDCIEAYGRANRDDARFLSTEGKILVAILATVKPSVLLRSGHRFSLRSLSEVEGYAELVIGLFPHCREDYEREHALEYVLDLPAGAVGRRLASVLKAVAFDPSDVGTCGTFVELLTRDGEWVGAVEAAKLQFDAIPGTTRERSRKLHALQLHLRAEFENLVSLGKLEEAFAVGEAWTTAEQEITEIREQYEKSHPFGSVYRSAPSQPSDLGDLQE